MRWLRCVTNLKLSSLLCALLFLALVKVGALVVLGMETIRPTGSPAADMIVAAATDTHAEAQAAPAAKAPAQAAPATPPAAAQAKGQAAAPAQATPPAQTAGQAPGQAPAQSPADAPLNWQALKQKQDELAAKESALKTLENDLNTRLQNLATLETRVKGLIDQANALKDEKMKHLISVYVNMKAKQAAQTMETLDEDVAVKLLAGMNGRQAGEILSNISPKKAARLTEDLTKMQLRPGM